MSEQESVAEEVSELQVSTARGSMALVTGTFSRAIILLVLLILLARFLGPSSYGLYTIVVAFYSVFEASGYLGIQSTLNKKLADAKKGTEVYIINNAYFISGTAALVLMIIVFLSSGYVANNIYHTASLTIPIEIASVSLLTSSFFAVSVSALIGMGKGKEAGIAHIGFAAGYLIISPTLVLLGYGVSGAVTGLAVGYLIGFIIAFIGLHKFIPLKITRPDKKVISDLVHFSMPIFVSNVAINLATSFSVLMLGVFAATNPNAASVIVGNYGVASKLGSFVAVIIIACTSVLLATFSHAFSKKELANKVNLIYNSSIYYIMLFLLPVLAYAIAVAKPLISLLFTYAYSGAPLYFSVVVVGTALAIFGNIANTMMIGNGQVRKTMKYQVVVVIIELVALVVLVPIFRINGLFLAMFLIGPLVLDYIYLRSLRKQFGLKVDSKELTDVYIAAAVLLIVMFSVTLFLVQSRISVIVDGVIALLLYPLLLAKLGGIKHENIEFLKKVSSKVPVLETFANYMFRYLEHFMKKPSG